MIRDATYIMHHCFKAEKNGLPKYNAHYNFIQSSTSMSIEKTFGMLKGSFKILLKKVNIPLHHMLTWCQFTYVCITYALPI
jgi:hypothetical protein